MSVDTFDRVFDAYCGQLGQQFMRETQRRMHWICSAVRGDTVLDVGSSQGILPILLAREGRSVTGIDCESRSIKDAERHVVDEIPAVRKRVSFIEGDFVSHPFGNERFDTIVMGEVLEHLVSPERFISKAKELLRDNGVLIVTVPFGINDHPDHKRTYYLLEPYRLLAEHFDVQQYVILGKWLGLTASKRMSREHAPGSPWTDAKLLELERAFNTIERGLVDDNTFLRGKLDEANTKYRAATEEVTRLQREVVSHDNERKTSDKLRGQLEARIAGHKAELQEANQAHENVLARAQSELSVARDAQRQHELVLARLEERHAGLKKSSSLELAARDVELAEAKQRTASAIAEVSESKRRHQSQQERLRANLNETQNLLQMREQTALERAEAHANQVGALQAEHDAMKTNAQQLQRELELRLARAEQRAREADAIEVQVQQSEQKASEVGKQLAAAKQTEHAARQAEHAAKQAEQVAKQAERKALTQVDVARRARSAAERKTEHAHNTLSFKLGYELIHGFKSRERALKLPKTLWALQQEAAQRRHDRHLRQGGALLSSPPVAPPLPGNSNGTAVTVQAKSLGSAAPAAPTVPATAASQQPGPPLVAVKERPLPAALQGDLRQLRVACINDEFTFASFSPECVMQQLTPDRVHEELEAFQPDLLFVESAWRGKDDLWGAKVGRRSRELVEAVQWCRDHGIPAAFWNKEDPVHFQGFLSTAQLFDVIFTTDFDCIHRYKQSLGHERVFCLPFACQPKLHNPLEKYERKPSACFAGAYYARYPERQQDLAGLARALGDLVGFEIYDRNYGKDDPNHKFPEEYDKYIVGTLPFTEIDRAYKGYRYALNLNSIKESQTMFARRVYELLASNTLTISNFSRGVRTMFGDLIVTTDNGERALQRLSLYEREPNLARRVRLAALRKVLQQHTYGERLRFIASQIWQRPMPDRSPQVRVVALAKTEAELTQVLRAYARQNYAKKSLLLVTPKALDVSSANGDRSIECLPLETLTDRRLGDLINGAPFVAAMLGADHYGDNYLTDLMLATSYSEAPVIGKLARYTADGAGVKLLRDGAQYRSASALRVGAALVRSELCAPEPVRAWLESLATRELQRPDCLALDEFNYCEGGAALDPSALSEVDDLPGLNHGLSLAQILATRVTAEAAEQDHAPRPKIDAKRLSASLLPKANSAVTLKLQEDGLRVDSTLPDDKHEYLYASDIWPISALGAAIDKLHFEASPGLNLQLALLLADDNQQRLGSKMLAPGRNENLTVPATTKKVQLALRVHGPGTSKIGGLTLDHLPEAPAHIFARSDVLLVTNHYPSDFDLYRNGFVHQRLLGYQRQGLKVDVFRLRPGEKLRYFEFEDVDVTSGGADALRTQLRSHRYRTVMVHFLDEQMWNVLRQTCPDTPLLIWVHGAEVQSWTRRDYNYSTAESLAAAKLESEKRSAFWRRVTQELPVNAKLIFVSQGFADESMEDNGFRVPPGKLEIIHNVIDTDLFAYRPKTAEHRKRILSLRPFASRKYANDLTVRAILELAARPFFHDLEFYFVGDGPLFEETVAPLRHLSNVKLERRFFAQREISELHAQYGIFLCPTRADSQGVSRDESMSSGLVPITSRVGAVAEFVDAESGILTEGENFMQLAEGVERLYQNPELFLQLSAGAAARVRRQSGPDQTTLRELELIRATVAGHAT